MTEGLTGLIFEELRVKDNTILKRLSIGKKDHKKILDIYALRVNLYKDFADKEDDPIIKAIIEAKKSVIMSDMSLMAAQFEIQYSIAKITLRLDEFEKEVHDLQDQRSS